MPNLRKSARKGSRGGASKTKRCKRCKRCLERKCKCGPKKGGNRLKSYKKGGKKINTRRRRKGTRRVKQRGGFRLLADNMRPWSVFDGTATAIGNGIAEVQGKLPTISPSVFTQHI